MSTIQYIQILHIYYFEINHSVVRWQQRKVFADGKVRYIWGGYNF